MIDKADRLALMESPPFRRFLFDLMLTGGLFDASGNDARLMFQEGRRSLVLDVLRAMEDAQPVKSPTGIPIMTAIQTLREEAQSAPKEKLRGGRDGPYRDLNDGDGD